MTGTSAALSSRGPWALARAREPLFIALLFLVVHALLAATIDANDPGAFLRADRAHERMHALQQLIEADSPQEFVRHLATHGVVGDYAAHALVYFMGARPAIIFTQIALALLSGIAVFRIGILIGLSRGMSALAMGIYLGLPHTLVFPHQLATEALHAPLVVISTWMLAEGLHERSSTMLLWSAVCIGVATLIRPISLLWPAVAGVATVLGRGPRHGAMYVGIASLPALAWMTFVAVQTGHFGLGESSHSMGRNLYLRVARITAAMPPVRRDAARATHLNSKDRSLGPVEYFRFTAEYPGASLNHVMRDAAAFFGKSGIERVTIDYLAARPGARAVQNPNGGWRQQLERRGPIATLDYLWRTLGPVLLVSLAGVAAMIALVVLACMGALQFIRRCHDIRNPATLLGLVLIAIVLYTFAFAQVVNAVQSRQRAPVEFAFVLLAVAGFSAWRERGALAPRLMPGLTDEEASERSYGGAR